MDRHKPWRYELPVGGEGNVGDTFTGGCNLTCRLWSSRRADCEFMACRGYDVDSGNDGDRDDSRLAPARRPSEYR